MEILEIIKLRKNYRDKLVLHNINLSLETGKTYFLLGKNGAGKSTLVNCIAGHMTFDEGVLNFEGKNKFYQEISYQPQLFNLLGNLKVSEVLDFFSGIVHSYKDDSLLYQSLGLDKINNQIVNKLSGGERKATSIYLSFALNKKILILDEPFAELDFEKKLAVKNHINKIKNNHILLIISHDLVETQEISSDLIILDDGTIQEKRSLKELYIKYSTENLKEIFALITGKNFEEGEV
ncbi:ATP-binding cassette domain-containing protein [Streptococcus suis]